MGAHRKMDFFTCCDKRPPSDTVILSSTIVPPSEKKQETKSTEASTKEVMLLSPATLKGLTADFKTMQEKVNEAKEKGEYKDAEGAVHCSMLKEERTKLKVQLKEVNSQRAKPEEGKAIEYTWTEQGVMGIRLQDTPENGVLLQVIGPDAPADMPNLVGHRVIEIQGEDAKDLKVDDVIAKIGSLGRPLTIKFQLDTALFAAANCDIDEFVDFAKAQGVQSPKHGAQARSRSLSDVLYDFNPAEFEEESRMSTVPEE